ncbi:Gem-associated protein 2 [Halotydeus destructor]|nr:Gem-associated protein 2 [Halotydeus destructor]
MSDFSNDDYSDDDGPARPPLLPVSRFTDYDPSRPPLTGQDYLRRVQLEAEKCPDIVSVNLDESTLIKPSNVLVEQASVIPTNADLIPSKDWQQNVVSQFSKLRLKIEQFKENVLTEEERRKFKYPQNMDIRWWRKYCLGKGYDEDAELSDVNETESSSDDDGTSETDKNDKVEPSSTGNPPLLREVCSLNAMNVIKLIRHHTYWIKQSGFSRQIGLWVYSLMGCLEKPLQSEVYADLRDLCRACLHIRRSLDPTDDNLKQLNLIIYIVTRYFNQLDLLEDSA